MYRGTILVSGFAEEIPGTIILEKLTEALVKVSFSLSGDKLVFRALTSFKSDTQTLMVHDRVTDDYILKGKSGFLYNEPNIHGGFLAPLNAFYFSIQLDYFRGMVKKIFFLGKKKTPNQKKIDEAIF